MITRIKIKNFKNLVEIDEELDVVNLISGNPGQGKTAIVEAINLHYTNKLNDKIGEYVRRGQKKFEIEVTELYHGKKIWHKIVGTTGLKHELIIDDDIDNIFYDSAAVKELAELYDVDIVENSNISMQHESTKILEQRRTPRLQTMKKIFKVDDIDKIVEDMKEQKKELEKQNEINHEKLQVLKFQEFNFTDLPDLPDITIDDYKKRFLDMKDQKELWEVEKNKYEFYIKALKQWEEAQNTIESYKKEIDEISKGINDLENRIVDIKVFDQERYDNVKDKINNIEKDLIELNHCKEDYNIANEKLNKLKDERKNLKIQIKKIDIELDKINVDNLRKDDDELETQLIDIEKKLINIQNEINLYEQGECPITKKECSVAKDIDIENVQKIKKEIKYTKKEKENKLDELREISSQYTLNYNKKNSLKKELKNIEERMVEWQEKIDSLENKDFDKSIVRSKNTLSKFCDELNDLEAEKIKYNRIKNSNDRIQEMLNDRVRDLDNYKIRIEEKEEIKKPREFKFTSEFDLAEYERLMNNILEYEDIEKERNIIEKNNLKLKEQQDKNNKKILEIEKEYYDNEKDINITTESYKVLAKDFSSYLIDTGTQRVKDNMNKFFGRSYGKYSVEFKQDAKGIDFCYSENGMDAYSVNMLSGFEKQVFAIAWRISLLPEHDLNFMILDEIDSDGPPQHSIDLYKTILEEDIGQIIAITHNPDTKEFLVNERNCNILEVYGGIVI